jgi:3-oxoacyl-[acyl-carrier-protein] synthase-3
MGFRIKSTAHAVPQQVLTNDDLAQRMETSDEWIRTRTGIRQRHIATTETTTSLAVVTAQQLLQRSGIAATELDFIIVCTMSPDQLTPSTAALVQGAIGANKAFAFDLNAACSGFIYSLSVAAQFFTEGTPYRYGLVIGSECLSRLLDWQDRTTAVLFGDGAGGVLLEHQSQGLLGQHLAADGSQAAALKAGEVVASTEMVNGVNYKLDPFKMDGRAVYRFATHAVPDSLQQAVASSPYALAEIDHFLLHQANTRIIAQVAKRLGQPLTKFPQNMAAYGNTSAASLPILLDECVQSQQVQRGDVLALSGFGGGLTVGSQILIY